MLQQTLARRSILAGLSVAPAAIIAGAVPSRATPRPLAVQADADLIAQAALVVRLAKLRDRAHERLARKEDAVESAMPAKPAAPEVWSGFGGMEEHAIDPTSDVERRCTFTFRKPPAGYEVAKRDHAEALAEWETEHDRLSTYHGLSAASAQCEALLDRVIAATELLIAMPATGPSGLAAKATTITALVDPNAGGSEQELDLMLSLARDVIRLNC